jgi:hypothetical protein
MFKPKYATSEKFFLSTAPLPQQSPIKEKSKRKYLWFLIAIILIVILAVAVYLVLFGGFNSANGTQITFTAFNEHLVIYPHNTDNTQPVNYDIPLSSFEGAYAVGQQITIQIPYSYQGETGTENITSIVCNTPDFSFASVSPELPVQLPNTRDNEAPITLTITFNTPSTPYTGSFDFTVYYDQYL